jgi:hypothetical protein
MNKILIRKLLKLGLDVVMCNLPLLQNYLKKKAYYKNVTDYCCAVRRMSSVKTFYIL